MDPQHEEIVNVLAMSVEELKRGIREYDQYIKQNPNISSRRFLEKAMVDMHQIAVKLNIGIEGLRELEALKHRLERGERDE